jgi:hypothetical protein
VGRIIDTMKELGIHLAQEPKRRLLALDDEWAELGAEVQRLEAANLHLQAEVEPLRRERDDLKASSERAAAQDDKLDEVEEKILLILAEAGANGRGVTERKLVEYVYPMHPTKLAVYLRGLEERGFLYKSMSTVPGMAIVKLNERGEKYLVDKGLV